MDSGYFRTQDTCGGTRIHYPFLLVCLFGKLLISVSLFMDVDIVVVTEVGKINYLVTSRSCKDG